jgi:serine phosphatase RsbU (regulator of sigma subunit)
LFIFLLINIFFFNSTFAQNIAANLETGYSIEICEDNSVFSVEKLSSDCFKKITTSELNKGNYQKRIWLKVIITDSSKKFIDFDKNIDSIKVYHNEKINLTGYLVAKSKKQLPLRTAINAIQIPVYNQPFYIEMISSKKLPILTGLKVLTASEFNQNRLKNHQTDIQFQIFFQGMMWIILLYNFFLYLSSKEKIYILYAIYIFGFSCFSLQNSGLLVDFLFPEKPYFTFLVRVLSLLTIALAFCTFLLAFLPSYTINKFWKSFYYITIRFLPLMTCVFLVLIYGFDNAKLYTILSSVTHGIILLFVLVFLGILVYKYWSDALVRYFLVGSFIVVGGAFTSNIVRVIFGDSLGNAYLIMQTGGILEILIFSLGLGYRMKSLEKENARFLENQNKILEEKVTERTREITIKQEEILVQNEELHQQQEEIISQRDYIEIQNQQLKHTNTQFTDSVRYAKTIQKAILPLKERVQNHFVDSFVLFRPRDIVSGDFYWFYETTDPITNEEVILIAVLDCTGHGVPGAFISLIGFAILNEIVAKENLTSPSEILTRLDERIQESLRQKQTNNLDGMDVALCAIRKINTTDSDNFEIKFSGAKRPLYFIKNNQLEELKGSKLSIGGFTKKKSSDKYNFEEDTIILSKNDKIYLTTDGFADQNGNNRQKIGSPKLKECFNEFHILPFAEQRKKFEEILDRHQGKQKQRDDITIMGIKL